MPDLLELPSYTDPAAISPPEPQKKPDDSEMTLREYIETAGDRIGVPKQLRDAIYREESNFSHYEAPGVVKRGRYKDGRLSGALGVSQLMPATAARHGVDINDPIQNAYGGLKEQKRLYDKYLTAGNNPNEAALLAAAAYNAGEGAVEKYHGIPPFEETQGYVSRIGKQLKKDPIQSNGKSGAAMTAPVAQEATSETNTQPAPNSPEVPAGGYLPHAQPSTGITPDTQPSQPDSSFYGLDKPGVTEGARAVAEKDAQSKAAVDRAFGPGIWEQTVDLKPEDRTKLIDNAQHMNTISDVTRLGEELSQEQDAARRAAIRRAQMRAKVQASKANQQRNAIIVAGHAEMIAEARKAAENADPVLGSKILTQAIQATPADVVKYMRDRGMRGGFDFNRPAPGVDTLRAQGKEFTATRQTPTTFSESEDSIKAHIRQQVMSETGGANALDLRPQGGAPAASQIRSAMPADAIEQETQKRYEQYQRGNSPEMIRERAAYGSMPWGLRAVAAPVNAATGDVLKALGSVSEMFGLHPNEAADYLKERGRLMSEAANAAPIQTMKMGDQRYVSLDPNLNREIERQLPEKIVSKAVSTGIGIAELVALKNAFPQMSMGQIMSAETFAKNPDLPLNERVLEAAKSFAFGKVLDQHLSRPVSALAFGGPTAARSASDYAKGKVSLGDAILDTLGDTAIGAVFGGKGIMEPISEIAQKGAARVAASEAAPDWAKRAAEWWTNYQQQAPPQDRAKGFDAAPRVEAVINEIRKQGPSPEAKAFFAGIEPRLAGTTIEKVGQFAENLGIPWEPDPRWVAAENGSPTPKAPTERSESPIPKPPQQPTAVEPAQPSLEAAQPVKAETTASTPEQPNTVVPENRKNPATYNGKAFWIGTVNKLDGQIENAYTHEQADEADMHHQMYMRSADIEGMENGERQSFWIDKNNEVQSMEPMSAKVKAQIWQQISLASETVPQTPVEAGATIDQRAHEAAHSPTNDLLEPTDAQKEAGNYKQGKVRIAGLDISIENPQGSIRSGVDKAGHDWSIELKSHYGYIRGYEGRDKDHLDVFVKPGIAPDYDGPVFVVNQRNEAGRFDEHKVMLGWGDKESAKQGYIGNYDKRHKGIGSIASFANPRDFKHWLDNGDLKKVAQDGKGSSDAETVRESQGQVRGGRTGRKSEIQSSAVQGSKDLQQPASEQSLETKAGESNQAAGALALEKLRNAGAEVLNPDAVTQGSKPKIRVQAEAREQPQELGRITPKQIVRHSDPNIDGGEVVGRFPDGDLKVQNKEGGISRVQDPRRESGNREAALTRRGIQVKAAPVEDATEPIKPPPNKRILSTRQEYVSERMRNLAPGSDPIIAQRSAIHEHEYAVKRAVKTGKFAQLVADKELTSEKAVEILKSLGGTVPNYIKRELASLQGQVFEMVGRKMAGRAGVPKSDPTVNSLSEEVRARGGIHDDRDGTWSGELARLKESGKRGLTQSLNPDPSKQEGMDAEAMAGELAQSGYFPPGVERDETTGFDVTNVGEFLNAVADDAAGSNKYYSTAYDPEIANHPDEEAFSKLEDDEYGKELLQLVQSGRARAADIAELARVGREHGLSDEGLQAFLRAMDEQVKSEVSETPQGEGYTLDNEGTLLDPDGQPLFSRIAQPALEFGDSEGLFAEGGPQPISEVRSDSAKQKEIAELNRKHAEFQREREQEVFGLDTAKRLNILAETKDRVGKIAQTILNDRRMVSRPDSENYIQSLVDAMETVRGAQAAQLPLTDYLRQDSLFGEPASSEVAELAHGIEAGNFRFMEDSRPLMMAREQTESDEFKRWFGDSKVVDEDGKPKVVYRGDYRGDRIGNAFKKSRATSGRFYFTEDPEIASRYSQDKPDTGHLEANQTYGDWFRFPSLKYPRERMAPNLSQAWYRLSPEQKVKVEEAIRQTRTDDQGEFVRGDGSIMDAKSLDWYAREARGNWLKTAEEVWLTSGSLYDDEERFGEILKFAGLDAIYDNPSDARSVVTPAYLAIQNPLDTSNIPEPVIAALRELAKSDRSRGAKYGADQWDKSAQTPKGFVERLDDDLAHGTTHAWTSVPEKITHLIQSLGYDGIQDTGGKMGGAAHTVWIAFEPTQIKSAIGNRGTFDPFDPNILRSSRTSTNELLDSLKSIDDDADLIRNLKSSREADIVWVNPEGQELLRRMESETASGFFGIQLDRDSAIPILRDLKAGSQALRAASLSSTAIDALHRQIVDAIHAGKGHALVVMEGESSETAIKHESFHQGSALGAAEKPLTDRHTSENQERLHSMAAVAKWRRYFARTPGLTNASKALAIEETAAEIAGDGGQRIGLTEQESAEFIYEWAKSFYETNGPKAFEAFRRQEDHVNKAIEAAKRFGYQVEAAQSLSSGKAVRGRKGSARGQPESSVSEVRPQAPGLGRRIELRGQGEVKEASLPETLSVAGLDTEGLYYQGFTDAQGRSDAAELLERHGVEGSLRLLKDTPNPGKEHAVLSFMVQRLLLDQAATASFQGNEEKAARLRSEQQELAAAHASHATHSGQFNQAAASAGVSVETALTVAQRIVQNEYGVNARVNPKIAGRIEEHARSAEQAFGETMALTVELGELRKRVAQLERERGARNPRNAVRIQLEAEEQGLINVIVKAFTLPPGAPVKMAVPAELSAEAREALAKLGVLELIRNPDGSIEDWNTALREKIGEGVEPYLVEAYTDAFALRRTMLKAAREAAVINEFHKTHPGATEDELADYLETQKTARERAKLVSGEKATKTRLLIRINELKTLIETGEKSVKGASATNPDIELLKSERDRLQGVVDEMAGPKVTPEDKRIELATKAVRKSIADYDKRIADGQVAPEPKANVAPWSEELGRLQTQRADLRKQLNEIRKQTNAPTKERNAIAAQLKAVTKSIGELEGRIQAGNIAPRVPGTAKPTSPEIEAAKAQRKILAKLLGDMRQAARPRQVKTVAEKEAARHLPVTRIIGEMSLSNLVAETAGKILFGQKTAYSDLLDAGIPKGQAIGTVKQAREIVSKAKQQAERERLAKAVEKDKGRKALDDEIDRVATERLLAKKRGSEARAELSRDLDRLTKPWYGKVWDVGVDISNSSRSSLAAGDFSFLLRQGGFLMTAYPEQQGEALKRAYEAFFALGELRAKDAMEHHARFPQALQAGIDFASLGREEGSLVKGEEIFRGDLAKKIPGWGHVVKFSDRTYAVFLDTQRLITFAHLAADLEAMGYTFRENPKAFRDIARLINVATGRGHLLGFKSNQLAKIIMNLPYFSARNMISRFQLLNLTLNPVAYARLSPGARYIVARTALRTYGTLAILAGLAALLGFKIILDWEDDDFGKLRVGNTRFDLSFGLVPAAKHVLRLTQIAARFASGRQHYSGESAADTIYEVKRFHRTKVAPGPAFFWDMFAGENFRGQAFKLYSKPRADKSTAENMRRFMFEGAIAERIWFLPVQDIQQAWHEGGVGAALMTAPASVTGIGVNTYKDNPMEPHTTAERLAAKLARPRPRTVEEPETEEKGETRDRLSELRARSMKNEDVKSELNKMVQSGEISNAQAKNVEGAKGLSKLEYWVRKLPPDQALLVVKEGSPAERRELLPLLYGKVQRAAPGSVDTKTQTDMAKLSPDLAKLFEQRKPVESELIKHDMKFPEANATISIGNREIKLTGDKLLNYQKRVDALVYERLPKIIQSSEYQSAEPSIQKKMLEEAQSIAHELATAEIKTELAPSDRILAGERRAQTKRDLGLRKRAGENVDTETNAALASGVITAADVDNLRKLPPPSKPFSMPKLLRRRAERRQDINDRRHPVP